MLTCVVVCCVVWCWCVVVWCGVQFLQSECDIQCEEDGYKLTYELLLERVCGVAWCDVRVVALWDV